MISNLCQKPLCTRRDSRANPVVSRSAKPIAAAPMLFFGTVNAFSQTTA